METIKPRKYEYRVREKDGDFVIDFISPASGLYREITGKMRDVILAYVNEDDFFQDDDPEATRGDYLRDCDL